MTDLRDLLAIPEAPLREVLDPGIWVEPKDDCPDKEDKRQIAFTNAVKRDAPHMFVHANRNGGKQTEWEKVQGERMGVFRGYPDQSVDWDGGSAEIEWKDGKGRPDKDQIACLNRLHRMGKKVAICRTKAGAWRWLMSIGAPVPEIRP